MESLMFHVGLFTQDAYDRLRIYYFMELMGYATAGVGHLSPITMEHLY
jgi:hypothetical protein